MNTHFLCFFFEQGRHLLFFYADMYDAPAPLPCLGALCSVGCAYGISIPQ